MGSDEKPYCCCCSGPCSRTDWSVDLCSGGFPCTPFTALRQKTGRTPRTGSAEQHPAFNTLVRQLEEYLAVRSPHGFWIEEVNGILNRNPVTGNRYMDEVASVVANRGYSIRVLVLNHNTWIKLARERVFLLGWHHCSGGKHAADWASAAVLRVTRIREAAGNR